MKQVDPVEGRASEEVIVDAESRLSRWSRRKLAAGEVQSEPGAPDTAVDMAAEIDDLPPLADEDMPSLETLTEDSDYTGFLSPKVSDELRKLALRKLFHGSQFNICDGLDDYDEDFTKFAKLGDVITAEMRQRAELEALRKLQQQEEREPRAVEDASPGDAHQSMDASIDEGSNPIDETTSVEDEAEINTEI